MPNLMISTTWIPTCDDLSSNAVWNVAILNRLRKLKNSAGYYDFLAGKNARKKSEQKFQSYRKSKSWAVVNDLDLEKDYSSRRETSVESLKWANGRRDTQKYLKNWRSSTTRKRDCNLAELTLQATVTENKEVGGSLKLSRGEERLWFSTRSPNINRQK